MYKLPIGMKDTEINVNKFVDEMMPWEYDCECPAFLADKDGNFYLQFSDVECFEFYDSYGDVFDSGYSKLVSTNSIDDEGNVTPTILPTDFTDEMNDIITDINEKITTHNPLPDPTVEIYSELEELDKVIPRWGEDALEGKEVFGEVAEAIARKRELRELLSATSE